MPKAIVTGGAGFIGSNLAIALQDDYDVIVIDDFSSGNFNTLIGFKGDILSEDIYNFDWESLNLTRNDVIFHQAAMSDTREMDQKRIMNVNLDGFRQLLQYAQKNHVPVVYASSAAVYGQTTSISREEDAGKPLNPYGYSKFMMDQLAESFKQKHPEMGIIGLRYFNVFGPREDYKSGFNSMIYQLTQKMLKGDRPKIFKSGEQVRDHVYVKDIVHSNILSANAARQGKFGVVNVATGTTTSFNRIVELINQTLGTNLEPDYIDNPYDFYQNFTQADLTKARQLIGYEPQYTTEAGIREYVSYLKLR